MSLLLALVGAGTTSDFNLAATEAADTFTATVQAGDALALAATEQADTFAATMVAGQVLALAATEAADTFSGTLALVSFDLDLAATEAADIFAGEISGEQRRAVGSGKRRLEFTDVIWPDDPRHPNYVPPIGAEQPRPAPQRYEPVRVVKLDTKLRTARPEPAAPVMNQNARRALALLLLAA